MTPGELARLGTLRDPCRVRVLAVLAAMIARGFDPYVGQSRRTRAQQLAAIERGTTSVGQVWSWHHLDLAVDIRRRLPGGGPDPTTSGPEDFWRALYEEASRRDLRCLAYKPGPGWRKLLIGPPGRKIWDAGHLEYREDYRTLTAAVRDFQAKKGVFA